MNTLKRVLHQYTEFAFCVVSVIQEKTYSTTLCLRVWLLAVPVKGPWNLSEETRWFLTSLRHVIFCHVFRSCQTARAEGEGEEKEGGRIYCKIESHWECCRVWCKSVTT